MTGVVAGAAPAPMGPLALRDCGRIPVERMAAIWPISSIGVGFELPLVGRVTHRRRPGTTQDGRRQIHVPTRNS